MTAHSRWLMLLVLFVSRTAMACQFQSVGSTAPFLADSFATNFARLGTLIGLYMLPGIFMSVPGGMLGQRFGTKNLMLVGLCLMALGGMMMGASTSFLFVAAGRLVSGVGAVLINVLAAKMVADWFAGREIVTAMAVLVVSWPFGLALGLLLFAPLAAWLSWNAVMYATALMALISLALIALIYRNPPATPSPFVSDLKLALTRHEWLGVSFAGVTWMTYNVGVIVLISFLPGLFTARGYSHAEAGSIVSLLGWVLIVSTPLAGALAERQRRPSLYLVGGLLIAGLAAAALPFVHTPIIAFGIIAAAIGAPAGPIMALPEQALLPENRGSGMGLYFTWYYAGMAVLPGLAGLFQDMTANPAAPALFASGMMALAIVSLAGFRIVNRSPV